MSDSVDKATVADVLDEYLTAKDVKIARLRVETARLRDVLADLLIECELTAVKHPQQIATRKRARAEIERGA